VKSKVFISAMPLLWQR